MQNAEKGSAKNLQGQGLHIGIVQSRFNEGVTNALAQAAQDELMRLGVPSGNISCTCVAGALEIPVMLQALAKQNRFDALIALGCIIRGGTYHFQLVANESAAGVSRVCLDYGIPIANAILTTENEAQAQARMHEKGRDAALVAVEMANLLKSVV